MPNPPFDPAGYMVVPRSPWRRWVPWLVAVIWPLTLVAAYSWATARAVPQLREARVSLAEVRKALEEQSVSLERALQAEANLRRSDQISRAANTELQATLAQREEEVAGLRADLAFYESLVGATGPRSPLRVHAAVFQPEAAGSWRYAVTLTQNLNRGGVTRGNLRFSIEGMRNGALTRLPWTQLAAEAATTGQPFSFRYFQKLEGSVVLPAGFTPQRVKVALSGPSGAVEQTLPWALATEGE